MRTRSIIIMAAALGLTGCGSTTEPPDEPTTVEATTTNEAAPEPSDEPTTEAGYPDFEDVDPYTHSFFIALEDTDLAEGHGEQALWNYGTRTCQRLDDGESVQDRVDEFDEYEIDVVVIAAAVAHICDQHRDAVQEWVDENS